MRVVANAHLPGKHRPFAHGAGPRDARPHHEDNVLADIAVVADVNEVIYLRAAAYTRLRQRPAVNGGVSSYLHVVFNHQRPLLRKLCVGA